MELILIRHTAVDVAKGICYGQTDVGLKETFESEAEAVKSYLSDILGSEPDPSSVFCSPLSRCRQLAGYCGFTDALEDKRIMEMNFGDWEMHIFEEITDEHLRIWFNNWIDETPTNGESFRTMISRVTQFIEEQKNAGHERIIAFTHGGVIACARIYAGLTLPERAFENPAAYGEIISIQL